MNPELDLIGCAMQDPRVSTASKVRPHQFLDGTLGSVWAALAVMADEGTRPTPPLVIAKLGMSGETAQRLATDLVSAMTSVILSNWELHAQQVIAASDRREVRDTAIRVQAMIDAGQPLETIRQEFGKIAGTADDDEAAAALLNLDEFIDRELPDEKWIIPDLLAAGDRMILTGGEGSGKSILLRQIAAAVAAGCHPFNRTRIRPAKVLLVDAENPERIMMRKLGEIRDALRMGGFETEGRMWIDRHPGGLDLTTPKGRTTLRHRCQLIQPDLLVIGPIYKLFVQQQGGDEIPARQVVAVIDEIRAEHDCAVLTEHHTPMQQLGHARQVRPVGTGLWQRWPEFGFGLAPQEGTRTEDRQMQLIPWRGSRDERAWPKRLQGSGNAPGRLPWIDQDDMGSAWRAAS